MPPCWLPLTSPSPSRLRWMRVPLELVQCFFKMEQITSAILSPISQLSSSVTSSIIPLLKRKPWQCCFEVYVGSNASAVVVYIDHNPLVFLNRMYNYNQKLMRWALLVQGYNQDTRRVWTILLQIPCPVPRLLQFNLLYTAMLISWYIEKL